MTTGFKGFDKDLKCRGFQYEIGKEYEEKGEVSACKNGFHFCENPMDVLGYYNPSDSRYCTIESNGNEDRDGDDSKVATSKIKIVAEIGLSGLIKAGVKFILDKVNWNDNKESNTGNRSTAANTGDQSTAANTGNRSTAANTGNWSTAANTGNWSTAANTGNRSTAANTGNWSTAANTGDWSTAANTGNWSTAANTGYRSTAANTGNWSTAANTGNWSTAIVSGERSVAMAIGYRSKAKGGLGCWIILAEHDSECKIVDVRSFKVDGEKIKADTFYMLENGEPIEVE